MYAITTPYWPTGNAFITAQLECTLPTLFARAVICLFACNVTDPTVVASVLLKATLIYIMVNATSTVPLVLIVILEVDCASTVFLLACNASVLLHALHAF